MNSEENSAREGAEDEIEESPYPPLRDYLESKKGHELASRIVGILEDVKKPAIDSANEQHKRNSENQKLWICLQAAVFALTIIVAALLAWNGRLDPTLAALMGTLFGYFLGRPIK